MSTTGSAETFYWTNDAFPRYAETPLSRREVGGVIKYKRILLSLIALTIVLGVAYIGLLWRFGKFWDDTRFAAGYTDSGFAQVQPGMSASQVKQILGTPLFKERHPRSDDAVGGNPSATLCWRYSLSGTRGWRHREIWFDENGVVVDKESRSEEAD